MRITLLSLLIVIANIGGYSQDRNYTAVNSLLFSYCDSDVYIQPPQKYNNGRQIISPNPIAYPWESRLENGMPNAIIDPYGNTSIYLSSFISYSPTPPSKVGVIAYTNKTSDIGQWSRPNAQLYWYNASGTTPDEKISSTYSSGYQSTNIVAVDIESLGIYDDGIHETPIQTIYMPQREFQYKYLGAYPMSRVFSGDGVLSGFTKMKLDRKSTQSVFSFKHINADTHMNWMLHQGNYYFTSRVNSRRSTLKPNETPPFAQDPRKRYRRNTITNVGSSIKSEKVDFDVVLDYSTKEWEPYSMQPFRMPGYEHDIWLGLVTVYGVEGYPKTEKKQRTELAISSNGSDWRYLASGTPFLDNGESASADDFGCINIATPVYNSKLHGTRPNDLYFYYASSQLGHIEGRNPGISLATSKFGKVDGLKSKEEKVFIPLLLKIFQGFLQLPCLFFR